MAPYIHCLQSRRESAVLNAKATGRISNRAGIVLDTRVNQSGNTYP